MVHLKGLADTKGIKQGRLGIAEVEEQRSCDFKVSGESFIEEVTSEQKYEKEEQAGSTNNWRKTVAGRKNSMCQNLGMGVCLMHLRNSEQANVV